MKLCLKVKVSESQCDGFSHVVRSDVNFELVIFSTATMYTKVDMQKRSSLDKLTVKSLEAPYTRPRLITLHRRR
jgi:hypothetical protein